MEQELKYNLVNDKSKYSQLKFINFSNLTFWDTKRIFSIPLKSPYKLVQLSELIIEQNITIKPKKFPNEDFKILGVNNKGGLFDAYIEKGKKINQPYQKVENGWLAYNPYRVNVGSVGIKTIEQTHEWISNAYVVFSCNEHLLPDYLFILFKTSQFNNQIRENTSGSVRQNLSFTLLGNIQIPLPRIEGQQNFIDRYNQSILNAKEAEVKANQLEIDIESFLNNELGIEIKTNSVAKGLQFVRFKNVDKWGIDFILNTKEIIKGKFDTYKIGELCNVGSGGTPSRSNKAYYNGTIPWIKTGEVINGIIYDTEEKITEKAVKESSAKLYPAGSLIIAMYGQGLTRGRTAKLGIDATTNQACAVLYDINNDLILTDYLWIYLQNEYHRLRELASGNNQPNLNAGMIFNYEIQVPPKDIQEQIIKEVSERRQQVNSFKDQIETLKTKAKEQFEMELFEA